MMTQGKNHHQKHHERQGRLHPQSDPGVVEKCPNPAKIRRAYFIGRKVIGAEAAIDAIRETEQRDSLKLFGGYAVMPLMNPRQFTWAKHPQNLAYQAYVDMHNRMPSIDQQREHDIAGFKVVKRAGKYSRLVLHLAEASLRSEIHTADTVLAATTTKVAGNRAPTQSPHNITIAESRSGQDIRDMKNQVESLAPEAVILLPAELISFMHVPEELK